MKELIKITTNEQGQQLVNARELHEGLEIKTKYQDWFKRMCEYGFEENVDFTTIEELSQKREGSRLVNRFIETHIITIDMAKEISMIQRNEIGKRFRLYFIECEKKLKEIVTPKLPQTYKEALLELVKTIEEKEQIEAEKNRLIHDSKTYTTTEIAKELGYKSATALNKDLESKKIQYKVNGTWVLTSRYSDKGYQSIKQIELDNGKIIYDRKWTGKGRDWLINEIYLNESEER